MSAIAQRISARGVHNVYSRGLNGPYICAAILYASLAVNLTRKAPTAVTFVHIPIPKENAREGDVTLYTGDQIGSLLAGIAWEAAQLAIKA